MSLSASASLARLYRQAHKLPEESFPDPTVWGSQISPPKGSGRGGSEHLVLLIKKQPTFMLVPSLPGDTQSRHVCWF